MTSNIIEKIEENSPTIKISCLERKKQFGKSLFTLEEIESAFKEIENKIIIPRETLINLEANTYFFFMDTLNSWEKCYDIDIRNIYEQNLIKLELIKRKIHIMLLQDELNPENLSDIELGKLLENVNEVAVTKDIKKMIEQRRKLLIIKKQIALLNEKKAVKIP